MTRAGYCAVIVTALLIAGFHYAGWSPIVLVALLALIWFGLSAAISFASDRRYMRTFDPALTDHTSNGPGGSSRLSIGRAILIGELVVNLPAVGLFVGLIIPVGSFLQDAVGYDRTGHAPALPSVVAVAIAFVASWAWWAIAAPRWLLWAMKRVVDPIALRNAVGSAQSSGRTADGATLSTEPNGDLLRWKRKNKRSSSTLSAASIEARRSNGGECPLRRTCHCNWCDPRPPQ
jgi:hypothetical protein